MDGKMAFKSRMLFSKLYEIIVNKVTFVGFVGAIAPIARLDPPLSVMMRLKFFPEKHKKFGFCLSKGILWHQRIRHYELTESMFRLLSRHHQLLLQYNIFTLSVFHRSP